MGEDLVASVLVGLNQTLKALVAEIHEMNEFLASLEGKDESDVRGA